MDMYMKTSHVFPEGEDASTEPTSTAVNMSLLSYRLRARQPRYCLHRAISKLTFALFSVLSTTPKLCRAQQRKLFARGSLMESSAYVINRFLRSIFNLETQ